MNLTEPLAIESANLHLFRANIDTIIQHLVSSISFSWFYSIWPTFCKVKELWRGIGYKTRGRYALVTCDLRDIFTLRKVFMHDPRV